MLAVFFILRLMIGTMAVVRLMRLNLQCGGVECHELYVTGKIAEHVVYMMFCLYVIAKIEDRIF